MLGTDGIREPGQSCRGIPELRPQASFLGGTLLGRGFALGGASSSPPDSLRALPWQLWTRSESLVSSLTPPPPTPCLRSGGPGRVVAGRRGWAGCSPQSGRGCGSRFCRPFVQRGMMGSPGMTHVKLHSERPRTSTSPEPCVAPQEESDFPRQRARMETGEQLLERF